MSYGGEETKNVIVTTLESLEGFKVKEYRGLITVSVVKRIPLRDVVRISTGGEKTKEKIIQKFLASLRAETVEKMREAALVHRANAVLGAKIHTTRVDSRTFECFGMGTAAEVSK